jgi:hypothetical protein
MLPKDGDMAELQLKPGTSWSETYARCVAAAPEAFEPDRLLNLIGGRWQRVGRPGYHVTPVDGSPIQGPPQVDRATAMAAVDAAVRQHADWGKVELDERKERVTAAVDLMATHRDLLALLLVWEIGKPDYRRRQHGEAPSQPKSRLWVPETPRTYATC